MHQIREALEASWQSDTAYLGVYQEVNSALGQCYPSARVVQHYFPATEIVEGQVLTDKSIEKHFWNVIEVDGVTYHIDFTWQQFPKGSIVQSYKVRDRTKLGDGPETIKRVELLLERVKRHLDEPSLKTGTK